MESASGMYSSGLLCSTYEHNSDKCELGSNARFSKVAPLDRVLNFKKESNYDNGSEPENKPCKKSIFTRAYVAIKKCVAYLAFKIHWALGYTLSEPVEALKLIIPLIKGRKENFTSYELNSRAIRRHEVPLIMAHGDASNQGVWTHLGKALKENNDGPGFTVNMPKDRAKRADALLERIKDVAKAANPNPEQGSVTVDLAGQSWGVRTVLEVIPKLPDNIKVRNCFLMSHSRLPIQYDLKEGIEKCQGQIVTFHGGCDPYEMQDKEDYSHIEDECVCPSVVIDTSGHFGLLTHKKVMNKIVEVRRQQGSLSQGG